MGAPAETPPTGSPYAVTIHGTVHNLAIGDNATAGPRSTADSPRPFLAPPLPPQGLIGRDEALTGVFDLLRLDDATATEVPPVALRGLGGVGKTTMAIATGRLDTVTTRYPDGVLWTALGPEPTVRVLLEARGRSLGLDLVPEPDEDACSDRLRGALYERRVLIIIDDVWHENDARPFLIGGPRSRTVLTTRETGPAYALATRARTLPVDVLSLEASLRLLAALVPEIASVERRSAEQLCERTEFLPLGLTLAGRYLAAEADIPNRMRRLLNELIERRSARVRMLQAEGRLGLAQHEPVSLQAMLGLSVDRLDAPDRERFAMLGTFGGDPLTWEVGAAADVWECSVDEAEATIARLIQRGLVEPRGDQYWMHALLADYAEEMLDEMER